jgi:hypothetical protein
MYVHTYVEFAFCGELKTVFWPAPINADDGKNWLDENATNKPGANSTLDCELQLL